jgi:poly(A) polymerase
MWLTGGSARDVVSGVPPREVRDLDLTGTVAPGRFMDIAYQTLRGMQLSEARRTVTPDSLVCAATAPRSKSRLFEYRGLRRDGFRFPVVGSSLVEDARLRDFSFNALLYDVMNHVVIDPLGDALQDALGSKYRFRPLNHAVTAPDAAKLILRLMKFALRWEDSRDLDLEPMHLWIRDLPPDLLRHLPRRTFRRLREDRIREVDASKERQLEFAASLPEPARAFVVELLGSSR